MNRTRTLRLFIAAAAALAVGASLSAQAPVPEIPFDSVDLLNTPFNVMVGEVGGVGTNSKGEIFVYTRTGHPVATLGDSRTFFHGGSKLFQFDRNGKYVRELGQDVYGFNIAHGLRVDPQDAVWTIDIGANQVVKFDANSVIQIVLGRKPETIGVRAGGGLMAALASGPVAGAPDAGRGGAPGGGRGGAPAAGPGRGGAPEVAGTSLPPEPGRGGGRGAGGAPAAGAGAPGAAGRGGAGAPAAGGAAPGGAPAAAGGRGGGRGGGGGLPGAGTPGPGFNRPTDVAWDRAGNIYVADGIGNNNRIAKFDKDGRFIKHWGSTGSENTQFNGVKGVQIDAQGNVYVADRGNKRIQVFDAEGTYKSTISNIGTPQAICISRGATQYIYSAHSGDPDGMVDAAIYKIGLDGKVLGKFGSAGKQLKQFGLPNSIDCRNENELLIGELTNWRVQKVTLKPAR